MKKKIILIVCVLAVVFVLTGCSGNSTALLPIPKTGNGFFTFILVKPIAFLLNVFSFGNYYALGIIITTLLVRTIAWPVYSKTTSMAFKMQLAQPEMARIQAKYASRQDPVSQQKMQREMFAVFKKYKVNPLGCIVAPLIQMPLFIAMYNATQRYPIQTGVNKNGEEVVSMFTKVYENGQPGPLNTNFLGIDLAKGVAFKDLAHISNWVYLILPLIVAITMVINQLISQKKPDYVKKAYPNQQSTQGQQSEKIMKIMMYSMTFGMFVISMQSGTVALYWIAGNTHSIIQTIVNKKTNEKRYLKARESNNIIG